ncbi:hypothetical protein [Streptomyces pacificus]|uniref:Uncharacterized protein n=1 Tax=Streptomyces pacificus TaxID=2705029 RepID=A0A6A0ATT0_9ACTN|nr:hypothetical protein [Streptomyces pacificus]GFH35731.1 hypothetical protein SCWH03_19530 [Streptomyces pacificus]
MRNPIAALLALLAWLTGALAPGSGRRRSCAPPAARASVRRAEGAWSAEEARRPEGARSAPYERFRPAGGGGARPRSPYGLIETLDGEATALVRPYLAAYERQEERAARRRWRGLGPGMAADVGVDLAARHVCLTGAAR